MNCKYLSKTLKGNLKCRFSGSIIVLGDCKKCVNFKSDAKKIIKKKSDKLKKAEKERYSIFTDELDKCFRCHKKGKMDIHEVWGGSNRQRSIKNGLCVPLCRECHQDENNIIQLRKELQEIYINRYGETNFFKLIGKKV